MALLLAGFEESAAHPVGVLTQRQAAGFGGRRYGSFEGVRSATGDSGEGSQTGDGLGAQIYTSAGTGGQGSQSGDGTAAQTLGVAVAVPDIASGGFIPRVGMSSRIDRAKLRTVGLLLGVPIRASGSSSQSQTGAGRGLVVTVASGASEQSITALEFTGEWRYRATGASEQLSDSTATGDLSDPELQEFLLLMMAA